MKSSSGHKPRIAMLSIEDAKKAAKAEGIPETMAPLSIFRILLKNPPLAREVGNTLNMLLFKGNQLDGRLRELIIMRLGWATGSNYEWTQHWRVATGMKIPDEAILAVKDWKNSKILTDADKAVLQATDDILSAGAISDAAWKACVKHVPNEAAQLEIVAAIGNWRMISQILLSLQVPLEEGVASWPPDGVKPSNAPADY